MNKANTVNQLLDLEAASALLGSYVADDIVRLTTAQHTLRKVFYGKFESWYRCREIFISVSSSNPKLGLFKPSLNTDVRKKIGITQ